jgi:thymidylate synthase
MSFEHEYAKLVYNILKNGEERKTRNGKTRALFGTTLEVDMTNRDIFPLLVARKMYYKGVLGELAAMLRGPKHIKDFELWGCNYWKTWAEDDGHICVDYGNAWIDYNGVNQLDNLIHMLKTNPTDRRLIISSWRPDRLDSLSLPCCHHTYQWYVRKGQYLDMLWMQRSVDTMIGLPSDIVLAAAWNIMIANEVGLQPGKLTFSLGDTHIYEEHIEQAYMYLQMVGSQLIHPRYDLNTHKGRPTVEFIPSMIQIRDYNPLQSLNFLLKE